MENVPGRISATFAYHHRTNNGGEIKASTMPVHLLTGSAEEVKELLPILQDEFGPGEIVFTDDPDAAIAELGEYTH